MVEQLPKGAEKKSRTDGMQERKPYRKPVLTKLGSLRDMTLSVGRSGGSDGAKTGNKRFTGRGGRQELGR